MTTTRFRIIDADGHVMEPPDMWRRHIAPVLQDRAPRVVRQPGDHSRFEVDAGPYHELVPGASHAPDGGRWAFQSLFALRWGIAGGTSEVQRTIIGERLLGLPR